MMFTTIMSLVLSFTNTQTHVINATNENKLIKNEIISNAYLGDGSTDILFNQLASQLDGETYVDDTYASYYFNNLRRNFGNNAYGSCGYVSVGMLLSFYDSYWDDSFISYSYDINSAYSAIRQPLADFDLVPSNAESPGIQFEPSSLVYADSFDEYLDIADQNKNTYFQFKLFDLANDCFGTIDFDNQNGELGLDSQGIYELLDYYTHDYNGYSNNEVAVTLYRTSNASLMKSNVVSNINNGNPVILVVKQPNTSKAHSVIAYDHNSSNGEIYVHTGWRDETNDIALTHVSLSDLGYTEIVSAISLNINAEINLGRKYYSQSSGGSYSSTFIFPREVELVSGNFADMSPTFSWKSLYSEKWETSKNPYINFSILNSYRASVFEVTNIRGLSYTLTASQWEKVRFEIPGEKYYVLLTLHSDSYPYWDDYWCRTEFTKPSTYQNKPYIAPEEYGFADAYPTDETTKTEFESHSIRSFSFETRRYRVGYIHNEDIVMSPIREGINEAFIEYRFKTALTRIDVDLSHWREQSYEWLSSSNGTAVVQQYIKDEWVTVLDLLSSETNLPRDRNYKNSYKIEFLQPTYRIRFYSKYNGVSTSNSNRGRICIGNMAIYESEYTLPLSGSELDYKGADWTSRNYNCYAYALNTKSHGFMQPGGSDGFHNRDNNYLTENYLEYMVGLDATNYNFIFEPIEKFQKCDEGYYKVALVIAPNFDYHWYRQNSDGTWSHKQGQTPAQIYDASGDLIYDPDICNRNYEYGNYNVFCGFYQVNICNMI